MAAPNAVLTGRDLTKAYLIEANLSSAKLGGAKLTDADLSGANLRGASLQSATITGANFDDAEIRNALLNQAIGFDVQQLKSTSSYKNANISAVGLAELNLVGANFSGFNLTDALLAGATLTGVSFEGADIRGVRFGDAFAKGFSFSTLQSTSSYVAKDLSRISMTGNLNDLDFSGMLIYRADFSSARLNRTTFANSQSERGYFPFVTAEDSNFSGATLTDARMDQSNFKRANFSNADLTGVNLWRSNITGANFTGANIKDTALMNAVGFTLSQLYSTANYQAKDLSGTILSEQDLRGADFRGVDLSEASMALVLLAGADLSDAKVTGTRFSQCDLTYSQLSSTASYKQRDLSNTMLRYLDLAGADFANCDISGTELSGTHLTGGSFSNADLRNASLSTAWLGGVSFDNADIRGANLSMARELTAEQIYSTASYKSGSLRGCYMHQLDIRGWNLAGLDLTDADVHYALYEGTDFSGADLRGMPNFLIGGDGGGIVTNTILQGGRINGLDLREGRTLVVRDYDTNHMPIVVHSHFRMDASSSLEMLFDGDDWGSTIGFFSTTDVHLQGKLSLNFASGVDVAAQVGRIFKVADWSKATLTGGFEIVSPHLWDVSDLYVGGTVTLLSTSDQFGDFDSDGDVDGADFLKWQLGASANPLSANDLADWQANFGVTSATVNASVPEPKFALIAIGAAWFIAQRLVQRVVSSSNASRRTY